MSRLLQRELFETKRQLEYFSEQQLSMQLGAEPRCWGVVLIKELVDNANLATISETHMGS